MNDTRRKMLTEYLGECWHEQLDDKTPYVCSCGDEYHTGCSLADHIHYGNKRKFDTAQDMVDLVRKMVEKWEWDDCHSSLWDKWTAQCEDEEYPIIDYVVWLITDPARTYELIAEWMEGKHE